MPSLCKAEDEFYTQREGKKAFENKKRKLENSVRAIKKKQSKKLQDTLERLKEAEKAEEKRKKTMKVPFLTLLIMLYEAISL